MTTTRKMVMTETETAETTTGVTTGNGAGLTSDLSAETSKRTDLILGISVGCGLLLLLIVMVAVICTCRKVRRTRKRQEIQDQTLSHPGSIDARLRDLNSNRHSDETSTDNPEASDPGSKRDSRSDRASMDGLSANNRDTGASDSDEYVDMSKSMTLFMNQIVSAPSPHKPAAAVSYVNTGKEKRLHNPEIEYSDDYENHLAWLEGDKPRSDSHLVDLSSATTSQDSTNQPPEQLGRNPVYFNVPNSADVDERRTHPPPKPHLQTRYVNVFR